MLLKVNPALFSGLSPARASEAPGNPRHHLFTDVLYVHHSGFYTRFEVQGTGKIYMDNENSGQQHAYWLVNMQTGFQELTGHWKIEPFIGLNNLLSADYADNIRINAFGARYFEPAPAINLYAGLSVKYLFQD
jgi:iron complex outermembrane receptor protein